MYLHDCLPLPWRALRALERARLAWPLGRALVPRGDAAAGAITLAALGDVFVKEAPRTAAPALFDGLAGTLGGADLVCCNLEAPIAGAEWPAASLGPSLRAAAGTARLLHAAGVGVVNVAGNHALDAGVAGFEESLGHLRAAGIEACGVAGADGAAQLVVRACRGLQVGFLGYCDDHAPLDAGAAGRRPALAEPEVMREEVAAAAARVDALVVQLHWGYEFRCHPLRRHRDLARELVRRGATLVLCHHAHVPMGVERHGDGFIAYGLGNGSFPLTPYMRAGHDWSDRSVLLEARLSRRRVEAARVVPFRLDAQGLPRAPGGLAAAHLARAIAVASARLDDDAFMRRCERAQLVFEGAELARAIAAARGRDAATLDARARTLALPRQQALMAALETLPGAAPLATALRDLLRAVQAGGPVAQAYDANQAALAAGADALRKLFDWRAALAARVP